MRQLCADYQAEVSEQKLKQKVQLKSTSKLVTTQPNKCHKRLNFNSTQRPKKKKQVAAASDEMWNKEITQFLNN